MDIKKHITALGFVPKDGTNGIYHKIYVDYAIEIDFEKQSINYGGGITADSKTTQNFSDAENFVVLECCLLYTSPSPRDRTRSRMPSSA